MYNSLAREIMNFLDWQPADYSYTRATLDSKPYQIVRGEDNTTIVFNALGICKEDVKVEINREHGIDYLCIGGETKNNVLGKTYSVNGRFSLDGERVKDIEWETKDGLLTVAVNFKEPEKSQIEIKAR